MAGTNGVGVSEAGAIERDLVAFIAEEAGVEPGGVSPDENLIEGGRIDSLGLLHVLAFIDERYRVDLLTHAGPRDLASVAAMAAAVRRELTARRGLAEAS